MASKPQPKIDHHFTGENKLLNATTEQRAKLRSILATLQQELCRIEGHPVKVTAHIKFEVTGPSPSENVYSVTVTNGEGASSHPYALATSSDSQGSASSPARINSSLDRRPSSSHAPVDDDLLELRPFKKARTSAPTPGAEQRIASSNSPRDEALDLLKEWRGEWRSQGGWLFDTLTKSVEMATSNRVVLEKKMDTVQDVLGQSMNSASSSTMAELANIAKLIPWLEHCRKSNADKVQAREEKWRSSSATFLDQNRNEREAAEKRLEEKLDKQQKLLVKLAKANGLDLDDKDGSRETSLGAQLTAELNLDASAAESANNANHHFQHEPITLDDD